MNEPSRNNGLNWNNVDSRVVGSHWRDITDLVWSGEPVCGCSLYIIWYCFIISPSCPVIRGDGETTDHWTRLCHSLSTNCREADIRFWDSELCLKNKGPHMLSGGVWFDVGPNPQTNLWDNITLNIRVRVAQRRLSLLAVLQIKYFIITLRFTLNKGTTWY